ncbi:hypothetical protein GC105_11640 [Alkalibaculum sp. M08DMB]|uniref:Uncharacterized protein n=1 Tax=Alkalibaculum sporogenes TaxID=2655001 RepID=A0A6A7KAP7_9FIRM|nr:hypothetical protein [Alkalibaculum sporogenes]MPW26442.1 hypothetical protein [Alkalibaculum sporogenes]
MNNKNIICLIIGIITGLIMLLIPGSTANAMVNSTYVGSYFLVVYTMKCIFKALALLIMSYSFMYFIKSID